MTQGLASNDTVPGLRDIAIDTIVDSIFKGPVLQLAILADTIKIYVCSLDDSRSLFVGTLITHQELYHYADSTKKSHPRISAL